MPPALRRVLAAARSLVLDKGVITWMAAVLMIAMQFHIVFVMHDFEGPGWLSHFTDDVLYYVLPAEHLVQTGRSSFDGITLTNGYHPLWFVLIAGIATAFDPQNAAFFAALLALSSALCLLGLAGVRALIDETAPTSGFAETIGLLYFMSAYLISRDGMESALVLGVAPWWLLMAARLWRHEAGPWSLVGFGLAGSLVVLSRLDAVFLVIPVGLILADRWRRRDGMRRALRHAMLALAGTWPLAAYLAFNLAVFGIAQPVSGAAKALLTAPGFSFWFIDQLFLSGLRTGSLFPLGPAVAALAAVLLLALPRVRHRMHPVLDGMLLFPPLFYLVNAWRSDWPLWPWYYYPLVIALPAAVALFSASWPGRYSYPRIRRPLDLACTILVLAVLVPQRWDQAWQLPPSEDKLLTAALRLESFARDHPGIYAMGDRAGKVAFLLNAQGRPLIQLEGLAADPGMVDSIAREDDLMDVLRRYGVNYYIATNTRSEDGCWLASEPALPGPRAPRMRTRICEPPLFSFTLTRGGTWTTRVFAVPRRS
ncbi:hypothetical protein [Marinivivus vitaminiproducens]|uniref:hypothetical protein n=1 Tax=Marinivivus vitaminiproducens TaxID=3035935 RepID=UPI0027A92E50|nr:hypothetical protein P4R82_12650 [Geminicoccaceae bacterium SCSIO 64248]